MKKLTLVFALTCAFAATSFAQSLQPKVSISYGSYRTPYWYILSQIDGTFPVGSLFDRACEVELRLRGYGSFYFVHPQSTDSQVSFKMHAWTTPYGTLVPILAFEADWRNFNDVRSSAVSTFAPVLGAEWFSRWDWFGVSARFETLVYRDGLTAKAQTAIGGTWGPVGAFVRLEASEVWSIQKSIAEFHWENFVGLSYTF